MKKRLSKKPTIKQIEKLWSECVKARAGYKSEISGKTDCVQSHHIMQKGNYRLKTGLENGICLTKGEHFGWHNLNDSAWKADREKADDLKKKFLWLRGKTEDDMLVLKRQLGGTDLFAVEIYLKQKLEEYKKQ